MYDAAKWLKILLFGVLVAACRPESPAPAAKAPEAPAAAPSTSAPARVATPAGWWSVPDEASQQAEPVAAQLSSMLATVDRCPPAAATWPWRSCWRSQVAAVERLAGGPLVVPGKGVSPGAVAWLLNVAIPELFGPTRSVVLARAWRANGDAIAASVLALETIRSDGERLAALVARLRKESGLDVRKELEAWAAPADHRFGALAKGPEFQWFKGFWLRRSLDGTAPMLEDALRRVADRLGVLDDDPASRARFKELADVFAHRAGARVAQRFAGQLDVDRALEFAAVLCDLRDPKALPRVIAHDSEFGTWEVSRLTGEGEAEVGHVKQPCAAAAPASDWAPLSGHLRVGHEWSYPAGEFDLWAFRDGKLVVAQTLHFQGGAMGERVVTEFDVRAFTRASLLGDDGRGALFLLPAKGEVSGPRFVDPVVVSGAKDWTGPADASLQVGVETLDEGRRVTVIQRDDVPVSPASESREALLGADHVQVWLDSGAVAVGCLAGGKVVVYPVAGPRAGSEYVEATGGDGPKSFSGAACTKDGVSFLLPNALDFLVVAFNDVDAPGQRTVVSSSDWQPMREGFPGPMSRVLPLTNGLPWPAVGTQWIPKRADE